MKKTLALLLTVLLLLTACAPQPPSSSGESSAPEQGASQSPSMPATPFDLVITGAYTAIRFPEGTELSVDPYGRVGLLLELEGRVLICAEDALWWVSTADGSTIFQQSFVLGGYFFDESIRAEAWQGDGYDHRIFTVDSVFTADSNGKKEPLVYTLPHGLTDTLTNNEARNIAFDLSPDGQTLAYTDAQGCWLADADGGGKRLVFATANVGEILQGGYDMDVMTPDYYQPRFFDNGKALAAVVWDGTGNRRVLSLQRLDTGEARHYELPIALESSLHYFETFILIDRYRYIDVRDFSEYTRPEQSGLTWDGDCFLNVDKWEADFRVLRRSWEDFETPVTLLETKNCRLSFGGMTRTISLWYVEPHAVGEATQYLLIPYR